MRFYIFVLIFSLISAFASEEIKVWKKCKKDLDCKMDYRRACGGFCYNQKFEKEAFEWEKRIVWECMPPSKIERVARCVQKQCACEAKK